MTYIIKYKNVAIECNDYTGRVVIKAKKGLFDDRLGADTLTEARDIIDKRIEAAKAPVKKHKAVKVFTLGYNHSIIPGKTSFRQVPCRNEMGYMIKYPGEYSESKRSASNVYADTKANRGLVAAMRKVSKAYDKQTEALQAKIEALEAKQEKEVEALKAKLVNAKPI